MEILEIKSLKIFSEHSIDNVIKESGILVGKDTLKRQCFSVKGSKCELKRSHSYHYQIQTQLMVTERTFCDFVLYAKNSVQKMRMLGDYPVVIYSILVV